MTGINLFYTNRHPNLIVKDMIPIAVAIVLIFILCHSYILAVKLYELVNSSSFNMEHYTYCLDLK